MRIRSLVVGGLFFITALLTPQVAQPGNQDDDLDDKVKNAIETGVEWLKRTHQTSGAWAFQGQNNPVGDQVVGCTALSGIALMECKVPVTDPHIQAAAGVIRAALKNERFNYTYSVALSLLFLDRLHRNEKLEHGDAAAIKRLAGMIVGGQSSDGGWTYNLTAGGNVSDNSNTQFALVALWVSRKYNLGPTIDRALTNADSKFRKTQRQSGGWGYDGTNIPLAMEPSGAMTCAGMLGLAFHDRARKQTLEAGFSGPGATGVTGNAQWLKNDPRVIQGKAFLLSQFQNYINGSPLGHAGYFFWSLERVATFYHWKYLDDAKTVDWYEMGCRYLVTKQSKTSGAWELDFQEGPIVDTAFALLFLSKSNLLDYENAEFKGGPIQAGGDVSKPKPVVPEAPKSPEQHAKDLVSKLTEALPNEQVNLLNELRDAPLGTNGGHYTTALLDAIAKLNTSTGKELAREALAGRIGRMTKNSVRNYLNDGDQELRLAALKAAGASRDLEYAPDLIAMLDDKDTAVSNAALKALEEISEQKFGKSVSRWNRWLETIKGKKP